jgi:hypothetical protein
MSSSFQLLRASCAGGKFAVTSVSRISRSHRAGNLFEERIMKIVTASPILVFPARDNDVSVRY